MENVVSLKEKITIVAVFPFCRVLYEISVSILASWTDRNVFSKHLRKPPYFSDFTITK